MPKLGAVDLKKSSNAFLTLPLSIMGLFATSLIVTLFTSSVLVRYSGWKRQDAVLAAVPGALSSVMAIWLSKTSKVRGAHGLSASGNMSTPPMGLNFKND